MQLWYCKSPYFYNNTHLKYRLTFIFKLRAVIKWLMLNTLWFDHDYLQITWVRSVTAAGIPDFRSPGSGLYDNLQKYELPNPQAIFEIGFFQRNPQPFFTLAKELYPGSFKPTVCHYFIRLLSEKGLLLRHYTQVGSQRLSYIPNLQNS